MRCAFVQFLVLSACIQIYISTCGIFSISPYSTMVVYFLSQNSGFDDYKYGV
jgi:hypothetical protein